MERLIQEGGLSGKVVVDSAGTGSWHVGEDMDPRAAEALGAKGYPAAPHRARRIDRHWLDSRDLLVALDSSHMADLRAMASPSDRPKIRLLSGANGESIDVPDPYYGTPGDFAASLELIEAGCRRLLEEVRVAVGSGDDATA